MERKSDEQLSSTPGASRVPFVGSLFRSTEQTSNKTELVILLRPVVPTDTVWGDQIQQNIHFTKAPPIKRHRPPGPLFLCAYVH